MGRNSSMEQQRCKKHPIHKQSTGVCPSCLREKLSQISTPSSSSTTNHSTSSWSPYSSDSNISSVAIGSPSRKIATTMRFSCILRGEVGKPLNKSRSLAFVVEERKKPNKKESKERFWSKLLGRRKEEKDVGRLFLHSNSKPWKEKSSSTKWALFA